MFQKELTSHDFGVAEIVRMILTNAGFHPMKISIVGHAWFAGGDQGYFVEVPKAELDDAREFLCARGYSKHVL